MISTLENNIYLLSIREGQSSSFNDFLEHLKNNEAWDAIVDLTSYEVENVLSVLDTLQKYQHSVERLLVITVNNKFLSIFPEDWTVVPSKKEAVDYILFEQMQRDLGF